MKPLFALCAALLPALASASPVHVSLRASAVVEPNAADFVTLGSVADLSGGTPAERAKLAAILIGRAPMPDETREITRGDLSLKMRQAGLDPIHDAVLGGAEESELTLSAAPVAPGSPAGPANPAAPAGNAKPIVPAAPPPIVIHAGASVTIRVDDGDLSISTVGTAETSGAAGDTIRVHRTGTDAEILATIVDSQTVELESAS
jgi:hypothetical protein